MGAPLNHTTGPITEAAAPEKARLALNSVCSSTIASGVEHALRCAMRGANIAPHKLRQNGESTSKKAKSPNSALGRTRRRIRAARKCDAETPIGPAAESI